MKFIITLAIYILSILALQAQTTLIVKTATTTIQGVSFTIYNNTGESYHKQTLVYTLVANGITYTKSIYYKDCGKDLDINPNEQPKWKCDNNHTDTDRIVSFIVPGLTDKTIYTLSINHGDETLSTYYYNPNPLPVELVYFKQQGNILVWKTAMELNSEGFSVEYSIDGYSFNRVKFLQSKHNTSIAQYYEYAHTKTGYYRLRQIDLDGSYEFSKVIYARASEQAKSVNTGSNVVSDYLIIHNQSELKYDISLYDTNGYKIYWVSTSATQLNIPTNTLSNGMYILVLAYTNSDNKIILEKKKIFKI
jgi:hypothetical protein